MAKGYSQKKEVKAKDDPTLAFVMKRFNASRSYTRKGFWNTWQAARKLYDSQRIAVNYEGNSDTFVPETFTIIQSVKSNVVGGKIKTQFFPTNQDQKGETKVLNALMEQIWEQDKTKLKASWAVDDSLQVGNGYLWQYWNGRFPGNLYIPTEDNFFDPQATNYSNLRYGGYRYLTTKAELEAETLTNPDYNPDDEKSEARVRRYKNLDQINSYGETDSGNTGNWKTGNDKTAKQLREEMIAGSVLASGDEKGDVVEVICYYDKKKLVRIANRCAVIEEIDTPFHREQKFIKSQDDQGVEYQIELPEITAFIPVAPARDYVDGAMWYAKGEIEVIGDLQELLNDTQNQKTDNLSYALNRMFVLDPSQAHKREEIQSMPGAVFTLPPGSLQMLDNASIGSDADIEMSRIQNMMRRATAADELIQGSKTSGDTTATEINAQLAQAGTRFGSKLENFESEFFNILCNNMFKIMQIFMTTEMAVRLVGQEGVEWKNYNPGEYLGDWDVKVSLEGTARALEETEKQEAMQFYLMSSKLPFINQEALFKMVAGTLFGKDDSDLSKLIQPMPQLGLATPGLDGLGTTQEGAGAQASLPQSDAEASLNQGVLRGAGINVPGMPS